MVWRPRSRVCRTTSFRLSKQTSSEVWEPDPNVYPSTYDLACGTLIAEVFAPEPIGSLLYANHLPNWQLTFEHEAGAGAAHRLRDGALHRPRPHPRHQGVLAHLRRTRGRGLGQPPLRRGRRPFSPDLGWTTGALPALLPLCTSAN
jgi:hypothetical protein